MVTGSDGTVTLPAGDVEGLAPESDDWQVVASGDVSTASEVWVHGYVWVEGVVVTDADPSDGSVPIATVESRPAGSDAPGIVPDPNRPPSRGWMRSHGIDGTWSEVGTDANGRFRLRVPRIQGASVRAIARGWMPAWERLDVRSVENGGTLHITLVITQSRRVFGRVTDAEGEPLSGIEVHVYTTAISSARSVAPDGLSMSGGAVSAQVSRRRDRAVVSRVFGTRTKEDGSFAIDVTVDGQDLLVVLPPGRTVVRRDLDPSRADEAVQVRVGDIGSLGKVTFTWDGEPLADSLVTISDVTLHMQGPQISLRRVDLDDTGSCSTEWLEIGRTYGFTIRRPRGRTPRSKSFALVWDAAGTVEVGPLDLALLNQR